MPDPDEHLPRHSIDFVLATKRFNALKELDDRDSSIDPNLSYHLFTYIAQLESYVARMKVGVFRDKTLNLPEWRASYGKRKFYGSP